ncbi:MAG: FGGY family carbohydrate kinase [Actinobacteria bacterium]|nr:FGGY family carbohydrate kinase [Actinomycetota bacterium]
MKYAIAIDAGTTSLKVSIFDDHGNSLCNVIKEYKLVSPKLDYLECDPNTYWKSCQEGIKEAVNLLRIPTRKIEFITISSQGETLIALDSEMNPLMNAIVWLDNRSYLESEEISKYFGEEHIFKITGQPEVVPTWPATKILWLKKNAFDLFNKTKFFLMVEDFLIYKLSGKVVTEGSDISSTLYFDINKKSWWRDMLDFLNISDDRLPEIRKSGSIVSEISASVAKDLSLSPNTIICLGSLDQPAGAIGAGNIHTNIASETTGGALAVVINTQKPVFNSEYKIPCHLHSIDNMYCLIIWHATAGVFFKWFRDEFCEPEKELAKKNGLDTFDILTKKAFEIKAGSDGLITLPHLTGMISPEFEPHAKGVFWGFTLGHTRSHFIRSVMESIAFVLKGSIEIAEKLGLDIKEVISMGGASKSKLWSQIKADVINKRIRSVKTSEAASLGVVLLAGTSVGWYKNLEQACEIAVKYKETFIPNRDEPPIYDKNYEIFKVLCELSRPIFKKYY